MKDQLSNFQQIAVKAGYNEAGKSLGQQVDAMQRLVDSYLKRSSAQEQHYKATDADIKQLGSWFTQNQQAISKVCNNINNLCSDIEHMTVTIKVEKAAPNILKKEFEKIAGMSTAAFIKTINIQALNHVLNSKVSQATQANANTQLAAAWVNQGLIVFRESLLLIVAWLIMTVITITASISSLFLPGALKGLSFVIIAIYLVVILLSWKQRNNLITKILNQVSEE